MNVILPNGVTIKGVPEGTTKDQIKTKAISAGLATAEDFGEQPQGRTAGEEAKRQVGRGVRQVVEGLTAIPSMVGDAIFRTPAIPVAKDGRVQLSSITDLGNMTAEMLGAGPIFPEESIGQSVSGLLTQAGLPEDEGAFERVTGDIGRALSAGGGVLGLAQRLEGPIATAISQSPGLQLVGETGGATASGVARESGVGPVGQLAAGLLGGVLAPTTAQATISSGRSLFNTLRGGADTARQLTGQRTPGLVEEFAGSQLPREALRRLRSAERLGEQITPAEALGDPILAARQGASGTSEAGARRLVDFGEERIARQGETIGKFLDDLAPSGESAAADIRTTAQKIIRQQQDALSKQAAPIYKKAFESSIDDETARALISDPVLAKYAREVRKSPLYQTEIGRIQGQSEKINFVSGLTGPAKKVGLDDGLKGVRFWDLVKRRIDDEIESSVRAGERNRARILETSRSKILESLDSVSEDYAAARAIYGEGARPLQAIREGAVGRIANLNDDRLKTVTKTLFDPAETDPQVLNKLRQQFIKENPDAWKRVIRNEIERRLDSVKGDRTGSTFYNTILSKDRDFRMFLNATRGMPDTQRTLIDMRRVWKDLINPESVKGAAGKAKSSLDVPRSSAEAMANFIKNRLGSQADQAAVELITDPNWADAVKRISAIKNQGRREVALLDQIIQIAQNTKPLTTGSMLGTLVNLEAAEVSE